MPKWEGDSGGRPIGSVRTTVLTVTIAVLAGVGLAAGAFAVSGRGPFADDGGATTQGRYERDWTAETQRLQWPGSVPVAPAFVSGSPPGFGRQVADNVWFCAWSRSWLEGEPASAQRSAALDQLETWPDRRDLWMTEATADPILRQARAGSGAGLTQYIRANCR